MSEIICESSRMFPSQFSKFSVRAQTSKHFGNEFFLLFFICDRLNYLVAHKQVFIDEFCILVCVSKFVQFSVNNSQNRQKGCCPSTYTTL